MVQLSSYELREKYLEFFKKRGHTVIESASLIPENDPTVLFTTAGMHPLVPYLMGQKHPAGVRLVNVQKCVRTGDIDDVGDNTHCTFFEMLGNWSLGDYFKEDSIKWSYEFLTSELLIPKNKLAVSVFMGDEDAPRDDFSASIWKGLGIDESKIFYLPKENNWWGPAGITGPCGPDTEIFIDNGAEPCSKDCSPACNCGKYIEIWNNVFMEYNKTKEGKYEPLLQKNVDTGMGLERTICILQGAKSVYDTDLFKTAIETIISLSKDCDIENANNKKAVRIIADHIRTATFIMGDNKGVAPSNVDQGYIVRRLIRRAIRYGRNLNLSSGDLAKISEVYINQYKEVYPELINNNDKILDELKAEEDRFIKTISTGLKEFDKVVSYIPTTTISGKAAFRLYDTFGFPPEMTVELAREIGYNVDMEGYHRAFAEHQAKSSQGAENKFKGGLQDNNEQTTRLHTATHLLLAALKIALKDDSICQKGSNITAERLRFDFSYSRPLTTQELRDIECLVNNAIKASYEIKCQEMTLEEAINSGATGVFGSRYSELVKVYSMGEFSKEICGGPHANNTAQLGVFSIEKEQSSSSGVRRIRAVLK